MAVGQAILTVKGIYAFADASSTGKSIKPKYYKVTDQDLDLNPELTDIAGYWKQADISGYIPINDTTVEFLVDIPPEEAIKYGRTFGLFLEDGTLFMIAKPPYPFPPALRQTFKIQLVYQNVNNLIDFKYLPFYETEQSLSILDTALTLGERIQNLRNEIELLKQARERLFSNDKENIELVKQKEREILEKLDEKYTELSLMLLDATSTLADISYNLRLDIEDLKNAKNALFDNTNILFNDTKTLADISYNLRLDVEDLKIGFSANKATNGYQKLPSGLIIQWGKALIHNDSKNIDSFTLIPLPIAFPNKGLVATASDVGSGRHVVAIDFQDNATLKAWSYDPINNTYPDSTAINFIAIGY